MNAWEAALAAPAGWRPAGFLAAFHGFDWASLGDFTSGEVAARLLQVRASLIGGALEAVTVCGACDAQAEFSLPEETLSALSVPDRQGPHRCEVGTEWLEYRVPTLSLLWRSRDCADQVAARRQILQRIAPSAEDNSGALLQALDAALADRDPEAALELALTCPNCGACWSEAIDLADFVWREFDALAERTLDEVARLARAYGWSEAEVLALSPARRARYLERAEL